MLPSGESNACHPELSHPTPERARILCEPMERGDAIGDHGRQHSRKEDRNRDASSIQRWRGRFEKCKACKYRERYQKRVQRDAVRLQVPEELVRNLQQMSDADDRTTYHTRTMARKHIASTACCDESGPGFNIGFMAVR